MQTAVTWGAGAGSATAAGSGTGSGTGDDEQVWSRVKSNERRVGATVRVRILGRTRNWIFKSSRNRQSWGWGFRKMRDDDGWMSGRCSEVNLFEMEEVGQ